MFKYVEHVGCLSHWLWFFFSPGVVDVGLELWTMTLQNVSNTVHNEDDHRVPYNTTWMISPSPTHSLQLFVLFLHLFFRIYNWHTLPGLWMEWELEGDAGQFVHLFSKSSPGGLVMKYCHIPKYRTEVLRWLRQWLSLTCDWFHNPHFD